MSALGGSICTKVTYVPLGTLVTTEVFLDLVYVHRDPVGFVFNIMLNLGEPCTVRTPGVSAFNQRWNKQS